MRQRRLFRSDRGEGDAPRAILYIRVSTQKQVKSGLSLEDQKKALLAEVERRGIEEYVLLSDGQSAKNTDGRPEFQRALSMLASGEYNLLITTKLDRMARNTQDVLELADTSKAQGWNIVVLDGAVQFDTTTATGRVQLTMLAAMAQFERDLASERTAMAYSVKREKGEAGLIDTETERYVVGLYRDEKMSMDRIAKRLNAENRPTARGGTWYASTVARVIERAALLKPPDPATYHSIAKNAKPAFVPAFTTS